MEEAPRYNQSVTFLVSKPKCQSQECDIFGFDTGFETKMSFSGSNVFKTCSNVFKSVKMYSYH